MADSIVIGGGLAGLTAAIRLADKGHSATLVTFGLGGLRLGQGTIDVLGYGPDLVHDVWAGVDELLRQHPEHPYRHFSTSQLSSWLRWLRDMLPSVLSVDAGSLNRRVPTALGAMRPTYLPQESMLIPEGAQRVAIVGPRQLKDFYPDLCAENLAKTSGLETVAALL